MISPPYVYHHLYTDLLVPVFKPRNPTTPAQGHSNYGTPPGTFPVAPSLKAHSMLQPPCSIYHTQDHVSDCACIATNGLRGQNTDFDSASLISNISTCSI